MSKCWMEIILNTQDKKKTWWHCSSFVMLQSISFDCRNWKHIFGNGSHARSSAAEDKYFCYMLYQQPPPPPPPPPPLPPPPPPPLPLELRVRWNMQILSHPQFCHQIWWIDDTEAHHKNFGTVAWSINYNSTHPYSDYLAKLDSCMSNGMSNFVGVSKSLQSLDTGLLYWPRWRGRPDKPSTP